MEKAIKSFLSAFKSVVTNEEEVDNIFIPNEEQKTLRIAKTVIPENRGDFNDTFTHINREMNKLRFNQ